MSNAARQHRPYLVGLVGSGVLPSLSPPMHMVEAQALGVPYIYRPIDTDTLDSGVSLADILAWCRTLGYDALNITYPFKQEALPLIDRVDETAANLGAVNTVVLDGEQSVGFNTDTTGFEQAFLDGLPGASLENVVVFGAGGGGSGVCAALVRLGVGKLTIVDPDSRRSQALVERLGAAKVVQASAPGPHLASLLDQADGAINCTPIGMHHHPGTPFDTSMLRPQTWVADIVYRPVSTQLLQEASAIGCRTLDGTRMAVNQAAQSFRLFTGIQPDVERMRENLKDLIAKSDLDKAQSDNTGDLGQ